MKIPKSFRVGNRKFTVHTVPQLPRCCRGEVTYSTGTVLIANKGFAYKYTQKEKHETLIHEMVHAVLRDMGSPYNKESFVEPFAKKLSKTILSARF